MPGTFFSAGVVVGVGHRTQVFAPTGQRLYHCPGLAAHRRLIEPKALARAGLDWAQVPEGCHTGLGELGEDTFWSGGAIILGLRKETIGVPEAQDQVGIISRMRKARQSKSYLKGARGLRKQEEAELILKRRSQETARSRTRMQPEPRSLGSQERPTLYWICAGGVGCRGSQKLC
jgi:hypothetical protein